MDVRPTKRQGPLTLLWTSRRFRWSALLVTGLPLLYIASFGMACWGISHSESNANTLPPLYVPVGIAYVHGAPRMARMIESYARFGMKRDTAVAIPTMEDSVMIIRHNW